MTRTAWNPQKYVAQANIVKNFIDLWGKAYAHDIDNHPLILTDEDIWDSYDSFHDAEADDDVFPEVRNRYDAMVLEDMRYKQEEMMKAATEVEIERHTFLRCKHGLHPLSCSECNPV